MAQAFPRLRAHITDPPKALLVTAWVQRSSTDPAEFLLKQGAVASLAEALNLISRLASQQGVPTKHVDIDVGLPILLAEHQGRGRQDAP